MTTPPITLARLSGGVTEGAFEQALVQRAPALAGSLLTWLHDDWYAVAPGVLPALRAGGLDGDAELRAAGATKLATLDAPAYAALLQMRTARGDKAPGAALAVDPPIFGWPTRWQGRDILVDWHLGAAGILDAWALLPTGAPAALAALKVAHIDTGYTPHPALGFGSAGGTWVRVDDGVNFFRNKGDAPRFGAEGGAWDLDTPEHPGPQDNHSGSHGGHGTRTASTIAGLLVQPGGTGHPYFGAAPGAGLVPYRITDSVFIDHVPDLLAKAMHHALGNGCQVINICLGALRADKRVAQAIDKAYEQGVIVCAAAGNTIPWVIYPGRFNRVLTVGGATTADGREMQPWAGASCGREVDVSAPSDMIRRATTLLKNGKEHYLVKGPGDGTSFGTSLTSGIALLWLALRGAELQALYGTERWARVAAFKWLAKATATRPPGWDDRNYGAGIVHAGRLLAAPLPALGGLHKEAGAQEAFDPLS